MPVLLKIIRLASGDNYKSFSYDFKLTEKLISILGLVNQLEDSEKFIVLPCYINLNAHELREEFNLIPDITIEIKSLILELTFVRKPSEK